MEYRYKIAYNVCLLAALLLIYHSINTAFGDGISGKTPDVAVHIVIFFIVMALILAAITATIKIWVKSNEVVCCGRKTVVWLETPDTTHW